MESQAATARQLQERFAAHVPTTLRTEHTLAVREPLRPLLVDGVLVRGQTVSVEGRCARSLALALTAGVLDTGGWVVVVGFSDLGLAAAEELGVDLDRVVLVRTPSPDRWASALAAVVGAVDLVLAEVPERVRSSDVRRLGARLRERGTALILVPPATPRRGGPSPLPAPDQTLCVQEVTWWGLGDGHGHLRARRVEVSATGRGRAGQPRLVALWLPDADGRITPADPVAPVTPLLRHPSAGRNEMSSTAAARQEAAT